MGEPDKKKQNTRQTYVIPIPQSHDVELFIKHLLGFKCKSSYADYFLRQTGCDCNFGMTDTCQLTCVLSGPDSEKLTGAIQVFQNIIATAPEQRGSLLNHFCSFEFDPPDGFRRPEELEVDDFLRPAPAQMDFTDKQRIDQKTADLTVSSKIAEGLMTNRNRQLLESVSGAVVEWDPAENKVSLKGSQEHVDDATKLLQRVTSHCSWGCNEEKVSRILRPKLVENVLVRLSPMNSSLPRWEKRLHMMNPVLTIGKADGSDLIIDNKMVSRQHCRIEFDINKGAVYVIDSSTNGTYLNGQPLPAKSKGKVMLSHGDDLVLMDKQADPQREFGWVVNIS